MGFHYILPQSFLSFVANFFRKKSKQHFLYNMNLSGKGEKERKKIRVSSCEGTVIL